MTGPIDDQPSCCNRDCAAGRAPACRRRPITAPTSRRAVFGGLVCAIALTGAVAAGAHPAHSASATKIVKLKNFAFTPAKLKIKVGTKVSWLWLDGDTIHNVTSKHQRNGLRFKNSADKRKGGVYSVTFKKPGVYYYECTIHPLSMQGEVIVR